MYKTAEILVFGRVQAVGYRLFAKRYADNLNVAGFAQNLSDGSVKVVASGDEASLARFIEKLQEGPRWAIVKDVKVNWRNENRTYDKFTIA
jgi:acylphosphatase